MHLEVLGEVIGAGEAFVASGATVRLDAGVGATVARQLVRAGEAPTTAQPRARERFLPRVAPHVRLEVRGLGVRLVAAGERAREELVGRGRRTAAVVVALQRAAGLHVVATWPQHGRRLLQVAVARGAAQVRPGRKLLHTCNHMTYSFPFCFGSISGQCFINVTS